MTGRSFLPSGSIGIFLVFTQNLPFLSQIPLDPSLNPIRSTTKSHQMQTQIPADPTQNPVGSNSKSQWMQSQIPTDRSPNSSRSNPKSQWIQHQIPLAPTLSLGVAHGHLCQELSLSAPDLPNLGGYRQRCELGWDPAGVGLGLPLPFHSGSRSGRGGDE